MYISQTEANGIYAHFLLARYGAEAPAIAQKTVQRMIAIRDETGITAWSDVFTKVHDLLEKSQGRTKPEGIVEN